MALENIIQKLREAKQDVEYYGNAEIGADEWLLYNTAIQSIDYAIRLLEGQLEDISR